MNLTNSSLRISLGTDFVADGQDITGTLKIGRDMSTRFDKAQPPEIAWRARLVSNGGTASVNLSNGTITANATPVAQVETVTVVAPAGATASGNLIVTITAAAITGGSALATSVPLMTGTHTTAALVAAAIRAELRGCFAITNEYTVGGSGADVTLTRLLTRDGLNDSTLNINIGAGLGVTGTVAGTSVNTTAGVRGMSIVRMGGDGKDLSGAALPTMAHLQCLAVFNDEGSTTWTQMVQGTALVMRLDAGASTVLAHPRSADSLVLATPLVFGSTGNACTVDIIVMGRTSITD